MKRYSKFILLIVLITLGYLVAKPTNALCWDCMASDCYYDVQCGAMCSCHVPEYQIQGMCISN